MILAQYPGLGSDLLAAVSNDVFWSDYLKASATNSSPFSLHLAVMIEPFLQYTLEGRKSVESRFSVNRCAPYNRVERGDVLLLKRTGGPIVGICQITSRWFYGADALRDLRLQGRAGLKFKREIETHSTEREVISSLPSPADLVVDGSTSPDEIATSIIKHLSYG